MLLKEEVYFNSIDINYLTLTEQSIFFFRIKLEAEICVEVAIAFCKRERKEKESIFLNFLSR